MPSAVAFAEARFPTDISFGSTFGPGFKTSVVTLLNGAEQRNMAWQQARHQGDIRYGIHTLAQLQQVIAFYQARQGQAQAFRFKWHLDWKVESQVIGIGDGTTLTFRFARWYLSGATDDTYTARIFKLVGVGFPVGNTYDSVQVFLGGTLQASGYTVDYTTGILTLQSAPASGVEVAASFEYDWPVRFAADNMAESLLAITTRFGRGPGAAVSLGSPQYFPLLDEIAQTHYYWVNEANGIGQSASAPPSPFVPLPWGTPPSWLEVSDEIGAHWYLCANRDGSLRCATTPPATGSGLDMTSGATPLMGVVVIGANTTISYTICANTAGGVHVQFTLPEDVLAAPFDGLGECDPIPIIGERLAA
jgi:uncharacterized protein (TIGR02217 family)